MPQKTTHPWTKVRSIKDFFTDKQQKFATLFDRKYKSLVFIPYSVGSAKKICKYSFPTGSVTTTQIQHGFVYPTTINENKIYTIWGKNNLMIVEITNNETRFTSKFLTNLYALGLFKDPYSSFKIIQDQIYCITANHFIKYNVNTRKHQVLPNSSILNYFGASLTQVKNKLILFGKIDHKTPSIQQYDIINNYWEILPVKLPKEIRFMSTTTILNQQMILILGIDIDPYIFIYEIKTNIFKKSDIKLPKKCNQIFAMNDKKRDNLIAEAWFRKECQNLYIPLCLKRTICKYYINEIIHSTNTVGNLHKIDVFVILNNWKHK